MRTDENRERFSMLETIREFSTARLEESGEAEEIRRAHAEFFRALAEEATSGPSGQQTEREQFDLLELNHENLRAALGWSIDRSPQLALALAARLGAYWYVRGYFREGRRRLGEAIEKETTDAIVDGAAARRYLALMCLFQGDTRGAKFSAADALRLYRHLDDEGGVARALEVLGHAHDDEGELEASRKAYLEALEIYERVGDEEGVAVTRGNLGMVALLSNDSNEARHAIQEALEMHRRLGNDEGIATSLLNLGWVALADGATGTTRELVEQGLRLAQDLHHTYLIISFLVAFAALSAAEDRGQKAARLLAAAEARAHEHGVTLSRYDSHMRQQTIERVCELISDVVHDSAATVGARMSLGETVDDALHNGEA